jgi:hypothetical protein
MSVICWRSGVPIEGEQPAISEPVIGQVPRAQSYSVLQSERGKRLETEGKNNNDHEHEAHGQDHGHETRSQGTKVFIL